MDPKPPPVETGATGPVPVDVVGPFRSGPPRVPAPGPPPLPEGGLEALGVIGPASAWEQRWVKTGSEVWRLVTDEGPRWLKLTHTTAAPELGSDGDGDGGGGGGGGGDLAAERDRLDWLGQQFTGVDGAPGTPRVVGFASDPPAGRAWLVTTEVAGIPAHDPRLRMGSIEAMIDGLGVGLRLVHDHLPVDRCPFDHRQDLLLASATRRLARGGIGDDAGGPAYDRLTPAARVAYAERIRPEEPVADLVVTHGDPCLSNLLVDPATGRLVGLVDMGRLGVSDRHRDLAILLRSFVGNFGGEHAWRLLEAYGHPGDPQRLEFHVLLDDLW